MAVMKFCVQLASLVLLLIHVVTPVVPSAQSGGPLAAYAFSDGNAPGRFGMGMQFTGRGDALQLPVTGLANAFTFESWINPTASVWSDFWKQMPDWQPATAMYTLSLTRDNAIYFAAYQGNSFYPLQTVQTIPMNAWTHVAVTFDGTELRIYFNASEVARRNAAGRLAMTSQPMEIGADLVGRMDEVRIYSRALGAAEIALDRATPVDPMEPFQVSVVTPADRALGVSSTPISATFSAAADPSTVNASTFELRDASGNPVNALVTYDPAARTATLTPAAPLLPLAAYTATTAGTNGMTGMTWTFSTAAGAPAPRVALAFNEGSGDAAADSSGNGNTGVVLHGAAWTTGVFGGGMRFDGVNADVQVPASDTTAIIAAFTFEAWVKPAVYAWGDLWSRCPDNGVSTSYIINLALTNVGTLYTAPVLAGTDYPLFTTVALPLDVWSHVALTYDGARLRIYVDGLEVASRAAHGSLASTPEPMEIGQWFHGSLDEVRIYGRALSAAEIAFDRLAPVESPRPLSVTMVTPKNGALGVLGTPVSAAFSDAIDWATLTGRTFELRDTNGTLVPATIAYEASTKTATLTPLAPLAALADYTARVSSEVSATAGGRPAHLERDVAWSFRTAAAITTPSVAYAFSEGAGSGSDDWSGNGNRAVFARGAAWDDGWFGASLSSSGASAAVLVPASDSIAIAGAFTFESWVWLSDEAWPQLWTRLDDQTGSPLYWLQTVPGGALDFSARLGNADFPLRTEAAIPLNAWTHVAATYDGARVRLYVNGAEAASRMASGMLGTTNQPMEIGSWLNGRIDEVRVYRRALAAADVVADMATPVDPRRVPPAIASLSPSSGVVGQLITITGSNFGPAQPSSIVTFSGIAAVIDSWTDASIVAIVPPGAPSQTSGTSGPVVVTANGLASNAVAFALVLPPVITAMTPAGGPAGQLVTIAGANFGAAQASGAVTFNGVAAAIASWSATSITATVPAPATTGPVLVSVNGVASNGVVFTINGPPIGASLSPLPNGSGWNNSSVTVTFTCTQTDSPVSFCSSPQTITFSGAGIKVTGKAIDQNGVTATIVALLNIDLTGPTVSVYSPRPTAVFPSGTTTLVLKGSAVDILSGAGTVSCAGSPATRLGQNFTCPVVVTDGTNPIQIVASDIAGRTTTKTVSIVVGDVPPTSLAISPATFTLSVDDTQALAVTDDRGRTVTGGTWTSTAPAVAAVSIDAGVPTLHAFAAGAATVTLARNGLSAQASVTVLAADVSPADGTVLWSLIPSPNPQPALTPGVREVVRAVPTDVADDSLLTPSLFFIERGPYYQNQGTTVTPTVIRAVTADGREVWKYSLPPDPTFGGYSPLRQAVPDDRGGLILLISSSQPVCCHAMNEVIRRLDSAGEVSWEYAHPETFGRFSEIALHPDGEVFVVEKLSNANTTELIAIDDTLGSVVGRYDLTLGHSNYPNASNASAPIVQDDGSVVTIVSRFENINLSTAPRSAYRMTVSGPGATTLGVDPLRHADGTPVNLGVGDFMNGPWPDGHGGLVVGDVGALQQSGFANLVRIGADLVTSPTTTLPFATAAARDLQYVLSDNAAYVLVQYWEGAGTSGAKIYKLNPETLGILDVFDLTGGPYVQLTAAIGGGGALYTTHQMGDASQVGYRLLSGWSGTTPVVQVGATAETAQTLWPNRRGMNARHHAPNLRFGISVKGQFVVAPIIHTSLHVVPRNQTLWANQPGFLVDSAGTWFLTIGAESSTNSCSGELVSDLNRASDLDPDIAIYRERLSYQAGQEDRMIQRLLLSDNNYTDDLPYACKPTLEDFFYNSNSYTHGLLNKVGLLSPLTPELLRPLHWGWKKPVESEEFDVR